MKIQLVYDRPSQISTDLLVVILDSKIKLHDLTGNLLEETVRRVGRDLNENRLKKEYFTSLDSRVGDQHVVIFSTILEPSYNVWESLKIFVARSIRMARDHGISRVCVVLNTEEAAPFIGKAVEGAILGAYTFDRYKTEKAEFHKVEVTIAALKSHDQQNRHYLQRYTAVSEAVNEARDMINEPGSVATPEYLAEAARKIAKESDLDLKVWDEKKLQKEGYNGLLQVGRGSSHPPRLIRLAYRARKAKAHLAFVGKGVTFDSGGISLKPAEKMFEMKGDMSGGAAVLYALKAIGKLKPDVNVTGIVPTAENFPDANAQRPGDIFYAKNGKSIMVDNTDAEGRLILNGLYLAGQEEATHILDIATLTGACVRALGLSVAGIMGNAPKLIQAVIRSGQNQGELFWELPLPAEYKDLLKTPYADLNNIGGPVAGALTAGLFLQEFVPEGAPWAHLDIAGPFIREKEWKYYEAGAIGFGLKTLVDLAQRFNEYQLMETAIARSLS
ncbi:MAG: leucyl aminopeptidase [Acidobacteria bacterium]|nr:MAG: leucyl aminopeptidase [Acidobacteriota bacterium]